MARIPIRDIPNAPGVVAQPTGGNLPKVNLGAAQSLLSQPTISPDAFQGQAKGMAALAAGVGSVAGAADKFQKAALHLQQERDDNLIFRARTGLEVAMKEAQAEIAQNPYAYERYGEITNGHLERAMKGIEEASAGLSEKGRERLGFEYEATRRMAYAEAQKMGFNRMRDENRQATQLEVGRLLEGGNADDAVAVLEEQRGRGRFSDTEIDAMQRDAWKAGEVSALDLLRQERPDLALERAKDLKQLKHLSPAERLREQQVSRTEVARRDGDLMDDVVSAYYDGKIQSVEGVKDFLGGYGGGFVERNRVNLERMLQKREFTDTGAARKIITELRAMDLPESDLERMELYTQKKGELYANLLERDRPEWKGLLDAAFFGEKRAPLDQQLSRWTTDIAAMKGFGGGYDAKKANEGDVEEIEKRAQTYLNVSKAEQALVDWREKNPKASDEEVRRAYQDIIESNGWMPPKPEPGFWRRRASPETLDEIRGNGAPMRNGGSYKQGAGEWTPSGKTSAAAQPGDRITSYGYANDSTPDSNSRDGIGAWVSKEEQRRIRAGLPSEKRLRSGDFAVSRDVERAMRAAGVKPEDEVRVILADGSEHVGRWMDRTAEAYNGKPLRGRIDLYSPDGVHAKDGVAVVGWEKV